MKQISLIVGCIFAMTSSLYAQQNYTSKNYGYTIDIPAGWTMTNEQHMMFPSNLLKHFTDYDTSYKAAPPPVPPPSQAYLDMLAKMDLYTLTIDTTNYITVNLRPKPQVEGEDLEKIRKEIVQFLVQHYKHLVKFGDYRLTVKTKMSQEEHAGKKFDKIAAIVYQDKNKPLYVDDYIWQDEYTILRATMVYDDTRNQPALHQIFTQLVNGMK